ncbi:MAG: VOC family protein [Chitinophagaceae bacterium]
MTLQPYLMFKGSCEEALHFYAGAFGGTIQELTYFEGSPAESMSVDKKQVMHASFIAKDISFMASDSGGADTGSSTAGMVHLSLNFNDVLEEEKVFKALSLNATITMPLQDTFWGARFGMLQDQFGINWMFNADNSRNA